MFLVAANTRQALVGQKEWITTGSSGIQVQFLFSDDWNGLSKFAVFRNAEIEESVIPIALPSSNLTELPAENCAAEYVDEKVYVGVYGTDGLGHIIIPTIWVSLGVLKEGAAYEGMDPPQPTPDMWAQILAIAQNAGAENAEAAEKAAGRAEEAAELLTDVSATATTLEPGNQATANYYNGVFEFGIPKGTKGDPLTYEDLTEEQKEELVQGPILDAQNAAVTAVGNARVNAVNAVGSAGTTAVNAVNQAGTTQVGNVNQAGTTQVQAVADKGAEVIGSIPPDYSDLADEVDDLNRQLNDETTGLDTKAPVIIDTASGAIASFSDGADSMPIKKLVAQIEPVQDLHGYDNPWPAGGGANKWDEEWELGAYDTTSGSKLVKSDQIRTKNLIPVIGSAQYFVYIGAGTMWAFFYDASENLLTDITIAGVTRSANAFEIGGKSFTMPAEAAYIKFYMTASYGATYNNDIAVNYPSTVTTYSPYENICPISGWTGAEIEQRGANLFDSSIVLNAYINGSGIITTTSPDRAFVMAALPNTQYSLSATRVSVTSVDDCQIGLFSSDSVPAINSTGERIFSQQYGSGRLSTTFTTKSDTKWICIKLCNSTNSDLNAMLGNVMLNFGSSEATPYAPYTGNQISVNWEDEAGTVYGGRHDVVSGILTNLLYNLKLTTSLNYRMGGSTDTTQTFYIRFNENNLPSAVADTAISNCFTLNPPSGREGYMVQLENDLYFVLNKTTASNLDELHTWIATHEVEFVYKVKNPTEYHLTPQEIDTLYGTNNIWSSTGDIQTCEYPADTKLYIDNAITQAIANALNS